MPECGGGKRECLNVGTEKRCLKSLFPPPFCGGGLGWGGVKLRHFPLPSYIDANTRYVVVKRFGSPEAFQLRVEQSHHAALRHVSVGS